MKEHEREQKQVREITREPLGVRIRPHHYDRFNEDRWITEICDCEGTTLMSDYPGSHTPEAAEECKNYWEGALEGRLEEADPRV